MSADAMSVAAEKHKVLVVDDEPGVRRGCERVLRAEGHTVLLAEDGEQGLDLLRQHPETDLALVDLRMPGISGLDFIAAARDVAPETVFVVITAYATLEAAIEATKRGAYDFLTKPFAPDELVRLVNRALERVRLIRERNRLEAERRRRLLELATEQSRLRTVIDCMADGVLVCNAEQELVLHNPAALKWLRHVPDTHAPSPVCAVASSAELVQMIATASQQQKRLAHEIQLQAAPQPLWALVDVAPVVDESSGRFLGTVTVVRDITELKRVEQVKAQFVRMVAHELRAPLAAVDSYLAVLLQGLVSDEQKQREVLARSKERLKAMMDLVSDLLDISRLEAGAVRREIAPQQVGAVLNEVMDMMRPLAEAHQVDIAWHLADGLPPLEADREELIRLFSNLVSNAIKYNKPGGRVWVTAEQEGRYIKVSVADTGVGISEEAQPRLFSEFFREKRPETSQVTGTGLGLSIVKRIVDFYHGRIEVQSRIGEGTTFTVWLLHK
ncbi:MAG: ATP-binding protein [Abditibacteriales bacterium]|nr:ATP-binding protein [Abditibacteriales bacterium]MDW8367797.1 ATP-binding protein [Abditibacteriales bacterium]